jgi:hypothetical protein
MGHRPLVYPSRNELLRVRCGRWRRQYETARYGWSAGIRGQWRVFLWTPGWRSGHRENALSGSCRGLRGLGCFDFVGDSLCESPTPLSMTGRRSLPRDTPCGGGRTVPLKPKDGLNGPPSTCPPVWERTASSAIRALVPAIRDGAMGGWRGFGGNGGFFYGLRAGDLGIVRMPCHGRAGG